MPDARAEASMQLDKEAGWAALGKLGLRAVPWLAKMAPKALKWIPGVGKLLARHAGNPLLWKSVGGGALRHARFGTYLGGGMGALGGALGAAPDESRLLAALTGGAKGAVGGGLMGATVGGVGGGLRYGLAPSMYRGAGAMRVGPGGKMIPSRGLNLTPEQARGAAGRGGRFTLGGAGPGSAPLEYLLKPKGVGRALSWLPGAASMALYMGSGGGGEAPGAAGAPSARAAVSPRMLRPPFDFGGQFGVPVHRLPFVRYMRPKAAELVGVFVKKARVARVQALVVVLKKSASLPQFSPVPLSSHTAIADYIKHKKYKPEPNEVTSDDMALNERLVAGMSRSSARAVGAHRRARNKPASLLKQPLQAAGLGS